MPEHLLHYPQVHPRGQGQRGRAMAQVVQADGRQARSRGQRAEGAGQPVGSHRVPVEVGEHQPARPVAGPVRARLGPLPVTVGTQRRDGRVIQGDDPGAVRRLGRADRQPAVVLLQLLGDHRGLAVQVDVAPAQPGGLAATQPAQRDQVVGGIQPVLFYAVQELRGLLGGPHRDREPLPGPPPLFDPVGRPDHRPRAARARQFGLGGRVLRQQSPADRVVQRSPQRGPDPGQGRGRDRRAQGLVLADDRGEHGLHLGNRQLAQQHLPQVRGQVQAHVRGIAAHGRRRGGGAGDQPVRQPVPHRQHPGAGIAGTGCPQPGQHRHRSCTGRIAAPPDPPAPPVQPGGQLQPYVPAPMPPASQPRARPPVLPAGRRIDAPAPAVQASLADHHPPPRIRAE